MRLEPLEDRRLLAVLTANTVLDNTTSDANLTLREAILLVNNGGDANAALGRALTSGELAQVDTSGDAFGTNDTIDFDAALSGGTINLSGTQLPITTSVAVNGLGASQLTIDANNASRVFNIDNGTASQVAVAISGLTISGGSISGDDGGGILNNEQLTITSSTLSGNTASLGGGGISNYGSLTVSNSTLSGNSVTVDAGVGGGILNGGTLTVTSSTISGNSADYGGGLYNNAMATITGSTLSGNSANGGGGLYNVGGTTDFSSSIISGNTAALNLGNEISRFSGVVNLNDDNLIGDNSRTTAQALEGVTPGASDITATSDGSNPTGLTSILNATLADNGGPTLTHALALGSPAINAGSSSESFDQRGAPFLRDDGNGVDIGAFELNLPASLVVDTLADEDDGDFSTGDLSLREAIKLANFSAGGDTVTFDTSGVFSTPQTITLGGTELAITDAVTITGPGESQLTLDAGGGSRIFSVDDGTATQIAVAMSGLTITGGVESVGGGILNSEQLTLTSSTVSGNSVNFSGGGIVNYGALTVSSSTVSGNSASVGGGGFFNSGTLTIDSSTLSGNTTGGDGGGITNFYTLTITNSTLTGNTANRGGGFNSNSTATVTSSTLFRNTATNVGGGIHNPGGTLTLENSIVDYSTQGNGGEVSGSGTVITNGANIVGDGSVTGTGVLTGSALLAPLADNGGPTQTHALLVGSQAINAGSSSETFDQRGAPFLRDDGNGVDIGAFERQSVTFTVDTLVDESDGDISAGDLSLREALELANANPGADTVTFDGGLSGTINLSLGQLTISDDVTVTGLGASNLTIDAGGTSRVLQIASGNVDISGLTISGGTDLTGGGIRNEAAATTTLTEMVISGNTATNSGGTAGGGIKNLGDLTITDSTVSGNSTPGSGGGLLNDMAADLSVTNSTVSGNSAAYGGGVFSFGTVHFAYSTVSNNSASQNGGGLVTGGSGATVEHSTITGNTAGTQGGGIRSYASTTIGHTIISGNAATSNLGNEISRSSGAVNLNDYNLIGDSSQTTAQALDGVAAGANDLTATSDGINSTALASILDTTLADNGGPTLTHAITVTSPAFQTGDPSFTTPPDFDQRGSGFARVAGGNVDIGAFELQSLPTLVVDTLTDESDGDYTAGDLSFREALELANGFLGASTVTFDGTLSGGTISLGGTELAITDDVTINGLGADQLTIDAGGSSRVFNVDDGNAGNQAVVAISGLTITGGGMAYRGGGIFNREQLTVTGSSLSGNSATYGGGLIL